VTPITAHTHSKRNSTVALAGQGAVVTSKLVNEEMKEMGMAHNSTRAAVKADMALWWYGVAS